MSTEKDCFEIASAGNPAYVRQFQLPLGDSTYVVKVGTAEYLQSLRERNASRPSSARVDERIYVFEDLQSAEQFGGMAEDEICQRLHQTPFEKLRSYLIKQDLVEQTDE